MLICAFQCYIAEHRISLGFGLLAWKQVIWRCHLRLWRPFCDTSSINWEKKDNLMNNEMISCSPIDLTIFHIYTYLHIHAYILPKVHTVSCPMWQQTPTVRNRLHQESNSVSPASVSKIITHTMKKKSSVFNSRHQGFNFANIWWGGGGTVTHWCIAYISNKVFMNTQRHTRHQRILYTFHVLCNMDRWRRKKWVFLSPCRSTVELTLPNFKDFHRNWRTQIDLTVTSI